MGRVLVCAATRMEHDACERGIAEARRSRESDHEMLLTGVGPLRAGQALAERLSRGSLPELVVSSGFAGALTPSLALSSWITATRLYEWVDGALVRAEGVGSVEPLPRLVGCEVVSSAALVESGALEQPGAGAIAVDMESVALAREAARRDVRFAVARLVSDTPARPLPAFLAPLTAALAGDTATTAAVRVALAARGVRAAVTDPRAVARLLVDSRAWGRALEQGWRELALRT